MIAAHVSEESRQPASEPDPPRPARRSSRAVMVFLVTAVVLLATDLVTKAVAFTHVAGAPTSIERDATGQLEPLPAHQAIVAIPRVLGFHLTLNEGAVFGLGQGARWVFVAFSVVAAIVLVVVFGRSDVRAWPLHLTLAAILAGALGNLYDRLVFGVVRDFLWLFPGVRLPFGWSWPGGSDGLYPWIFNIADVCLVVGLIVLMVLMHRHDRAVRRAAEDG